MKILNTIFIALVLAFLLPYVALRRREWTVGALSLGLGIMLHLYYLWGPVPQLQDYQKTVISYQDCYFDKEQNAVTFVTPTQKYFLPRAIINLSYSVPEAEQQLKSTSQATVWLTSPRVIRGIETGSLRIPIEAGWAWEVENRKVFRWLGNLFGALGLVLIIILSVMAYFGLELDSNIY